MLRMRVACVHILCVCALRLYKCYVYKYLLIVGARKKEATVSKLRATHMCSLFLFALFAIVYHDLSAHLFLVVSYSA